MLDLLQRAGAPIGGLLARSKMPANLEDQAVARGVLESLDDELMVLAVGGTDYKIHLVPTVPARAFVTPVGKRIRGSIEARALRIHPARGGGRFIEPVWGAPRIVAGQVIAVDEPANRVLVDVGIPVWVIVPRGQDSSILRNGRLVNFYVQSGTTFTPLEQAEK